MELKEDPEGSFPGLLKGRGQKSRGNQNWWVDKGASWGAEPPHGISRAVSIPGQALSWAGTIGRCSRNKGSPAGAGFGWGQAGQGPQNVQKSGGACTGRNTDGLRTSHAYIFRGRDTPHPPPPTEAWVPDAKEDRCGKGVLFPRKPGEKSPFARSGAAGSGSVGHRRRGRGGATTGHRRAAGRGQDFIGGLGAFLGSAAEQVGARNLGFGLRLLEPSDRSKRCEDVRGKIVVLGH